MMAYIASSWVDSWVRAQGGHGHVLARVLFSLGTAPSNLFIYFLIALLHLIVLVVHFTFICTYLASIWSYYIALVNVGLANMEQIECSLLSVGHILPSKEAKATASRWSVASLCSYLIISHAVKARFFLPPSL